MDRLMASRTQANAIPPCLSLTFWTAHRLMKWRDEPSSEPIKIAAAEIAFLGIALFGLIETIVRLVLALLLKPIDLFVSEESWFSNIYEYLPDGAALSGVSTVIAIEEIATNLLSEKTEVATGVSIFQAWRSVRDFTVDFKQYRMN